AVFAMLLTLLLIWFVSRAVVGPVRRLTAAAREMSQRQLPALVESLRTGGDVGDVKPTRIEVRSEDEIGELAQAFNDDEAAGIDDQLAVSGRAVSDVAHLLAELLENATSFSPPESPVVVSGAVSAGGFVLAISDQGIGMPPERVAEANRLLAQPPVVGLALSRALGLHVVGSLAARHAIAVELRPGPS